MALSTTRRWVPLPTRWCQRAASARETARPANANRNAPDRQDPSRAKYSIPARRPWPPGRALRKIAGQKIDGKFPLPRAGNRFDVKGAIRCTIRNGCGQQREHFVVVTELRLAEVRGDAQGSAGETYVRERSCRGRQPQRPRGKSRPDPGRAAQCDVGGDIGAKCADP